MLTRTMVDSCECCNLECAEHRGIGPCNQPATWLVFHPSATGLLLCAPCTDWIAQKKDDARISR